MPPPRRPRSKAAPRKKKPAPKKSGAAKKRAKAALVAERPAPAENPVARGLAVDVARLVLDKKAEDIVVLDVRGLSSYADYLVLASGDSDRQVSAMGEHVHTSLKHRGRTPLGHEGLTGGNWVLLDYGEVVAHLFHKDTRSFYDLEGLWADAPRVKVV